MRKTMILVALCIATVVNAQNFRMGVTAGLQLNKPSGGMTMKAGYDFGVRGEMNFGGATEGLFLDAAVLFDAKNWKTDGYYDATNMKTMEWKYSTLGISVPVNVGYKFAIAKQVKLFAAAGPYINIGLGGKDKVTETPLNTAGGTIKTVKTTASDNVYSDKLMNRVEWGLGFKVGVEVCKHYQLGVGYGLGLSKIYKKSLDSKHRTFNISAAYMF